MLTGASPNLLPIDPVLVVGTGPVLVEGGALTFPELATPLLVAAVVAVALWVLVLLGVAFATRARGVVSGPATMDLAEEPPAVVDLVTNDWRVTPDAIPATLLDLAARGYLDLEQYRPGRTVCRVRRPSGNSWRPATSAAAAGHGRGRASG